MRGHAHGDHARSLYADFEARLTASLGCEAMDWPPGFGTFSSRMTRTLGERPTARLPRLAPEQSLLLTGPLARLPLACARVYAAGLETCFGTDASLPLGDDTVCRALLPAVPDAWRDAWQRGLGLDPPRVFAEGQRESLRSVLATLARGEPLPHPLPEDSDASAAVVLAFATVTLQWAGEAASRCEAPTPSARAA